MKVVSTLSLLIPIMARFFIAVSHEVNESDRDDVQ